MTTTNNTIHDGERLQDEAVWTCEIDGIVFQLDDSMGLAFVDLHHGDEARLVSLDRRQHLALMKLFCEIYRVAMRDARRARDKQIADLCLAMTEARETSYPHIAADVLVAPNCYADSLNQPPRVRRDADGFQRLEVKGTGGWHDEGVVEEVTRLSAHDGLVLVATDQAVYLMTAQDFDNPGE